MMMKCLLVLGVLTAVVSSMVSASPMSDLAPFGYEPKAAAAAMVISGNARFTVLSEFVVRMEFAGAHGFEDRATLMAVNRLSKAVPQFTQNTAGGVLTIETNGVHLEYRIGQPFSASSLTAVMRASGAKWHFGDVDHQNLLGTVKSLDGLCTVDLNCTNNADIRIHHEGLHCGWGVVSRGGWTTIDDTNNYIMSAEQGGWFGFNNRSVSETDVYLFGHGSQYRAALKDYVALAGKAPLPKKALLGSWFTRWYDYDNTDVERLVSLYEQYDLPLDVLVLDMNWHKKDAWTGFSWDKQLFPNPVDTVNFLHSKGLLLAANIHDAEGIGAFEDLYPEMCKIMGMDPAASQTIPFQPLNKVYMHGVEDTVLHPTGIDFCWIDWQQGGNYGGTPGGQLNPTFITDHVRGTNNIRNGRNDRDNILARWGGMGSHRYPVGFSGDVAELTWQCFAFQPYFSVTAANVAYGSISHDLVGPMNDHELHVRWMQFGSFSGVLRIHDRGMSAGACYPNCPIVNLWKLPEKYFLAIKKAMKQRVALMPYMYTATRNAYDTGVAMVYPMYYDFPAAEEAYAMGPSGVRAQYMFGSSIIVAPVTVASGETSGLTSKTIWVPPGQWYDDVLGLMENGGTTGKLISRKYGLHDVPMFMKAGVIIPRIPDPSVIGVASQPQYRTLDVYIYPGAQSGDYTIYDDDALSMDYTKNTATPITTKLSYTRGSASTMSIKIGAVTNTQGSRKIRVFIVGAIPMSGVQVQGATVAYDRYGTSTTFFRYDGPTVTAEIDLGTVSTQSELDIEVTFAVAQQDSAVDYVKGYAARLQIGKRSVDNFRVTPYSTTIGPGITKKAASTAGDLSFLADPTAPQPFAQFTTVLEGYKTLMAGAIQELGTAPIIPPGPPALTGLVQLWDFTRKDMALCGTAACISGNSNYQVMWVEGYQPLGGAASTQPLYGYYDATTTDNFANTSAQAPAGYTRDQFNDGTVFTAASNAGPCLQIWFNAATGDRMTLASPAGKMWATTRGYVMEAGCVGRVAPKPLDAERDAAFLGQVRGIQKRAQASLAEKAPVSGSFNAQTPAQVAIAFLQSAASP